MGSSTVFSPLQTVLVNPSNVSPSNSSNSSSSYFTDQAVLDNVPTTLIYMAAIYAVVFVLALLVTKEEENTAEASKQSLVERLASAWSYVYREAARTGDFYLLWLARFLYLTVGAGVLAHWKTFAFTQSSNDQIVAITGSVSGVVNCLSRLVSGFLIDKFGYNKLMSIFGMLLAIDLVCLNYIAQLHFAGLIIAVWLVYFFAFAHFSTITAHAHCLFAGPHISVVIGCVGLAQSFSYGALGILNKLIMDDDSYDGRFLIFFLALAACSLLSVP